VFEKVANKRRNAYLCHYKRPKSTNMIAAAMPRSASKAPH